MTQCSSRSDRLFENAFSHARKTDYNHDSNPRPAQSVGEAEDDSYGFDLSNTRRPKSDSSCLKKVNDNVSPADAESRLSDLKLVDKSQKAQSSDKTSAAATSSQTLTALKSKNEEIIRNLVVKSTNDIRIAPTVNSNPQARSRNELPQTDQTLANTSSSSLSAAFRDLPSNSMTETSTKLKHKRNNASHLNGEAKKPKIDDVAMNLLLRNQVLNSNNASLSAFKQVQNTAKASFSAYASPGVYRDKTFDHFEGGEPHLRLPIAKNGPTLLRTSQTHSDEPIYYNNVEINQMDLQSEKTFVQRKHDSARANSAQQMSPVSNNSKTKYHPNNNNININSHMSQDFTLKDPRQTTHLDIVTQQDKSSVERQRGSSSEMDKHVSNKLMQSKQYYVPPARPNTTSKMENSINSINYNWQQQNHYAQQQQQFKQFQMAGLLAKLYQNQNFGNQFPQHGTPPLDMNFLAAANAMPQSNSTLETQNQMMSHAMFQRLRTEILLNVMRNSAANAQSDSQQTFSNSYNNNLAANYNKYAPSPENHLTNEHEHNISEPFRPRNSLPPKKRLVYDTPGCQTYSSMSPDSFTSSEASASPEPSYLQVESHLPYLIENDKPLKDPKAKRMISDQPKKIKRCPHVWQFCGDLLENEKYNPSHVKWLNKEKGIFKIVKPDLVAELWGAQKNRKTDKKMNYEKMARGMRYSRREGFFKKLEKEKNKPNEYGKQLVFQFSEKAIKKSEWKWSFNV